MNFCELWILWKKWILADVNTYICPMLRILYVCLPIITLKTINRRKSLLPISRTNLQTSLGGDQLKEVPPRWYHLWPAGALLWTVSSISCDQLRTIYELWYHLWPAGALLWIVASICCDQLRPIYELWYHLWPAGALLWTVASISCDQMGPIYEL